MKHSFKMPKHVDFVRKFCICCFRKGKDLRPINNAETTYLNLNKTKEDCSNLIKTLFWKYYSADNLDRKKLTGTDPYFTMRSCYEGNYKYIDV